MDFLVMDFLLISVNRVQRESITFQKGFLEHLNVIFPNTKRRLQKIQTEIDVNILYNISNSHYNEEI
ncbi:hypothetical protein D3C76_278800 [compost metagenome]